MQVLDGIQVQQDLALEVPNDSSALLLQGDATCSHTLPFESVDLTITSPPYNVGKEYDGTEEGDALSYSDYLDFTEQWLHNVYLWTKPTGRLCVNVSLDKNRNGKQPLSADITRIAMKVGWLYHATVIWNEGNISRRTAWGSWKSASAPHIIAPVETVIILYKDNWKRERQGDSDITKEEFMEWVLGLWTFNGENGKRIGHEAPFPRALPLRCIKLLSFPGDTVFDPFVGSGTTMVEALANNRNAIGIEIQEKYCQLTTERVLRECQVKLQKNYPATPPPPYIKNCWETQGNCPVNPID